MSTAVQRGWVYRYGRMIRNVSGSEDRDRLAPLGGEAVRSSDLRWPSTAELFVRRSARRPADVLIQSHPRSHGLGREPAHAVLDRRLH